MFEKYLDSLEDFVYFIFKYRITKIIYRIIKGITKIILYIIIGINMSITFLLITPILVLIKVILIVYEEVESECDNKVMPTLSNFIQKMNDKIRKRPREEDNG